MAEMMSARMTKPEMAELHSLAGALDKTTSQVMRELVYAELPRLREEAKAHQWRKANIPHGVTETMTEEAADELMQSISRSSAVRLDMSELFSPKSKALLRLLQAVWGEQPGEQTKKLVEKLAAKVADRLEKLGPDDAAPPIADRPKIRDHRRRRSQPED